MAAAEAAGAGEAAATEMAATETTAAETMGIGRAGREGCGGDRGRSCESKEDFA
jgi:hypothetical protein